MKKRLVIIFLLIVGIIFACSYVKEEENYEKEKLDKLEIVGRWKVTHVWNIYNNNMWRSIEELGENFMYADFGEDDMFISKVNEEISYGTYEIINDKIFCKGECISWYYSFIDLNEESAIVELSYIGSSESIRIKVEKVIHN